MKAKANVYSGPLAVEYRPISSLVPYARNARTHSDAQIEQVMASIREFGWTNPILVDDKCGIIAGHARLEAAKRMSVTSVPTICLVGLSEAQKRAYILADNKLALNAGWEAELLRLEVMDLKDLPLLDLTGFDGAELADIMYGAQLNEAPEESIVPDAGDNVLVKLSFPSAVWLGKREEIMKVITRMEKSYLCTTRVDE